jgi:serine phosphatase RsbU (regulator of sigma subunit)
MNLSLRSKLLGIFLLAGLLPLAVAVTLIWTMGYRHRIQEEGIRFQSEAVHVAAMLEMLTREGIGHLRDILVLGDIAAHASAARPVPADGATALDARWSRLDSQAPEVAAVTENPLAARLRAFQEANPLFAEILVADRAGHLAAATNKTTDYEQGDESWWRQAMELRPGEAVLEGLAVDQSSGVFSLDIAMPVFAPGEKTPAGVIKGVLNISPFFADVPVFDADRTVQAEVVRNDGRAVLRIADDKFRPETGGVSLMAREHLLTDRAGWFIDPLQSGAPRSMVGQAPFHLLGVFSPGSGISGPMFHVIVHRPAAEIVAPLRQRTIMLLAAGSGGILLCVLAGVLFVQRGVLRPIETLRRAAAAVAATVSRANARASASAKQSPAVRELATIRTGDEIEELARDFTAMAARLLDYQSDLQREIAAKTAEIQRDLDLARDFQQAFLPRTYPRVCSGRDALTLEFHHIYHAASTVSGDFFDLVELDDRSVGVLVADVMGHGTRSALVTAILRTILQSLARSVKDPGHFLELLNRHFCDTMRQTDQLIFVSAAYVVIDTEEGTLACASAGHPSPILANRDTGEIDSFFHFLKNNPALGLFPSASYTVFTRRMRANDVLLLFTDGVIEALNEHDEDFGRRGLEEALARNLGRDLPALGNAILEEVLDFTGHHPPEDDICLVAVEAVPVANAAALQQARASTDAR